MVDLPLSPAARGRLLSGQAAGIAAAFMAFALFACADALIKSVGGRLGVFEIGFWVTFFGLLPLALSKGADERFADLLAVNNPRLVLLRVASGTIGGLFAIVAFTTLPLAEAYALIFLAPFLTTVLSVVFLGEPVGWRRWTAVAVGFLGVLVVVRPGFRALEPGHLAAAAAALCSATTMTTLRRLGPSEKRFVLVGWLFAGALAVNGMMMLAGGPELPAPEDALRLAVAGILGGIGQLGVLAATRLAPVNRVAPAQYSQIAWALVFGALFFDEVPDALALFGIGLVLLSGLFTLMREDHKGLLRRRLFLPRNRP